MKTMIVAITFLWGTVIFSAFFVLDKILMAQVALLLIALDVSIHLITCLPSKSNKPIKPR
jgi:hypothetical protein